MSHHHPVRSARSLLAGLGAAACAAALTLPAPAGAAPLGGAPTPFWTSTSAGLSVTGSYQPIVGQFGGAGSFDDILWYAPGAGTDHLWTSDGDATFTAGPLPQQVAGTYTPVVGDFAGTALDDVFWYAPGPAADYLWTNTGGGFASTAKPVSGTYVPAVLDDAAGKDDIVWANPNGGPGHVWSFEGGGQHLTTPLTSPAGSRPLVGRFDDGACADVLWYAPGPGADSLWSMNCAGTAGSVTPQTVNGTYEPMVHDLTPSGDGLSDILWHRHPGGSSLWQSDGDGTFTSSAHVIPMAGTPLPVAKTWGLAQIWSPTSADLVFWKTVGGDHVANAFMAEPSPTTVPLVGAFVGTNADIFWYAPGAGMERLDFHP